MKKRPNKSKLFKLPKLSKLSKLPKLNEKPTALARAIVARAPSLNSELAKRIVTGFLGGLLLLLVIIFGHDVGIVTLVLILSFGMVKEFAEMVFSLSDQNEKGIALLIASGFIICASYLGSSNPALRKMEHGIDIALLMTTFLGVFGYFLFSAGRHAGSDFAQHFKELMFSLFGIVYLIFLPLYLLKIHNTPYGKHWTVLFLLIVWFGDSAAYFTGKKFGKHKLYALISPKKTVEGSIGGLFFGTVAAILYRLFFFPALGVRDVIVISIIVGIVSQIGDLCESFMKRAFDKKDSGTVLPGHGGFLDRFDGVIFSLPVMYGCISLFDQ